MGFLKKLFAPKAPTIIMPDPTPVPVPEVTPAAVMPDTDAAEVNRAKTAAIRQRMQRGGRASTIMSQSGGGGVGGDSYSNTRLG